MPVRLLACFDSLWVIMFREYIKPGLLFMLFLKIMLIVLILFYKEL